MVCAIHTIGSNIVLDTLDGTLGDEVKWMLDSLHLEIVLILMEVGAWFATNVPQSPKSFWMHPMILLGDEAHVEA
jgi:hypothetical protein